MHERSIAPESNPPADNAAPGHSWARFFRNQERLSETRVHKDLAETLRGADCLVLAVRHKACLDPDRVVGLGRGHVKRIKDGVQKNAQC